MRANETAPIPTPEALALLTKKPWQVPGISRASWYRLESKPHPVKLPGMSTRIWRIRDLQKFTEGLQLNRKPGKRVGQQKSTTSEAV